MKKTSILTSIVLSLLIGIGTTSCSQTQKETSTEQVQTTVEELQSPQVQTKSAVDKSKCTRDYLYDRIYNTYDVIFSLSSEGIDYMGNMEPFVSTGLKKLLNTTIAAAREANANGDYQAAVDNYKKVIEIQENFEDGKALFELAQAYEKLGDSENAKANYNRVNELFPDSALAKRAVKAVEKLSNQQGITLGLQGKEKISYTGEDMSKDKETRNFQGKNFFQEAEIEKAKKLREMNRAAAPAAAK